MASNIDKAAGYFEERDGTKSSSRLLMVWGFVISVCFGIVAVVDPARAAVATNMTLTFLIGPSGLKTVKDFAPQSLAKSTGEIER